MEPIALNPKMLDFIRSNQVDLQQVTSRLRKKGFGPAFLKGAKTTFQKIIGRQLNRKDSKTFRAELLLANQRLHVGLEEIEQIRSQGPISLQTGKSENSDYALFAQNGEMGIDLMYMSEIAATFYKLSLWLAL